MQLETEVSHGPAVSPVFRIFRILWDSVRSIQPACPQCSPSVWHTVTAPQTFPPDPGPHQRPFPEQGQWDPRATMDPSVASDAAWGAAGGVGWAEGRRTRSSTKHSSTLQRYFILGSNISPLQQNMCLHVREPWMALSRAVPWWQLAGASSLP